MSEIKRVAWLGKGPGQNNTFIISGDGIDFWRAAEGYSVSGVVEVQPVLDALKRIYADPDMVGLPQIIDQLEKAVQP